MEMQYIIWVKQSVLNFIFSDGNFWAPRETGGVLMGYRASDSEFVVTDIIGPGEKAVHGLITFKPNHAFHKREIARKYKESNHTETYLGDWHTHPNSFPYLSDTDKATHKRIALHKPARLYNPLMLIAAPPGVDCKIWVYAPEGSSDIHCHKEAITITF